MDLILALLLAIAPSRLDRPAADAPSAECPDASGNFYDCDVRDAQQCGWLKDKYGLSWQIVPKAVLEMYKAGVSAKSERAFKAMMQMKKLDLAALQNAYDGAD